MKSFIGVGFTILAQGDGGGGVLPATGDRRHSEGTYVPLGRSQAGRGSNTTTLSRFTQTQ